MCLYVRVCDYLALYVFWLGLVDFNFRRVFYSFWTQGYFGYFKWEMLVLLSY